MGDMGKESEDDSQGVESDTESGTEDSGNDGDGGLTVDEALVLIANKFNKEDETHGNDGTETEYAGIGAAFGEPASGIAGQERTPVKGGYGKGSGWKGQG